MDKDVMDDPLEKPIMEKTCGKKSKYKSWRYREQKDGIWLGEHDGQDDDPLYSRIKTNLNRVGQISALQHDVTSLRYCGEVKERALAAWITDAWRQICQIGIQRKKYPILFLHIKNVDEWMSVDGKKVRMPNPLHCLTPARHQELLEKEKRLEELEAKLADPNAI